MELMSFLLLYALVAFAPQTKGKANIKSGTVVDMQVSKTINHMPRRMKNRVLLNLNAPRLVNEVNELQVVFNDVSCSQCISCMERAIKAHKIHSHVIDSRPTAEEVFQDILMHDKMNFVHRNRRYIKNSTDSRIKKRKSKKNKILKNVKVEKYTADGVVFALRIKEMFTQDQRNDTNVASCDVYLIQGYHPCESDEGTAVLRKYKKGNKQSKKVQDKKQVNVVMTTHSTTAGFKKREVDHHHFFENYMPSIEDLY